MPFVLLLLAAPVVIEPLGFSVKVADQVVVVSAVVPGSVAAEAGLAEGMVISYVQSPQYLFAQGPLASLSEQDLDTAVTPPHGEPLLMVGATDAGTWLFAMNRTDPRPKNDFPDMSLPPEQIARLSMIQSVGQIPRG